jgi:hypothetical protein
MSAVGPFTLGRGQLRSVQKLIAAAAAIDAQKNIRQDTIGAQLM